MRFFKTLRWLFNHPPVHITTETPPGTKCDYCGKDYGITNYEGIFCICHWCQKEAFDSVLSGGSVTNGTFIGDTAAQKIFDTLVSSDSGLSGWKA